MDDRSDLISMIAGLALLALISGIIVFFKVTDPTCPQGYVYLSRDRACVAGFKP